MILRKLSEDDLTMSVLYILYTRGDMDTGSLKQVLLSKLNPGGHNLDPLENRNDTAIHQIIRNIISHREDSKNNIIKRGLINYNNTSGILSITDKGIKELDNYMVGNIVEDLS